MDSSGVEYGISRKTGYKWLDRYERRGVEGLQELSRRPQRSVSTSGEMVLRVLEARQAHPRWGPKKIHALLKRVGGDGVPTVRTIARILVRAGGLPLRRRKRTPSVGAVNQAPPTSYQAPNTGWTVDFKGWWRTRDGKRAEPLTVRDAYSRYVLCALLMSGTRTASVKEVFVRLFEQYGLPEAIQVDNGPPFASTKARGGLTELSAWWVALGIRVTRGRPGHPQDNGAHERMHADMRFDLEDDSADDLDAQQKACDAWVEEFNHVRPHEALGMQVPGDLYRRSTRRFRGPKRPCYPPGCELRRVDHSGHVRILGAKLFVAGGLRGHDIGLQAVDERYRVWFYDLDLGFVGEEAARNEPRK